MAIREELAEISKRQKEASAKCDALRKKYEAEAKEITKGDDQRYSQLETLVKRIKAGESTGDPLLDFGVVHYQITDEEELKPLRKLHESSKKNVGGLVLVVTQHTRDFGPQYLFSPHPEVNLVVETEKNLAVLSGEARFSVPEESLTLPCEKYSHKGERDDFWKLVNDDLKINAWSLRDLGKILEEEHVSSITNAGLQIYFGEADVEKQFKGDQEGPDKKSVVGHLHRRKFADYSYYAALKLLGREAPKDFKEKYTMHVAPQAARLLEKIRELEREEEKLVRYIRGIESQAKDGKYTYEDDDRYTTVPVNKFLAHDNKNLESVRNDIKLYLQEAIEYCIFGLDISLDTGKVKPLKVDDELRRYADAYDFKLSV
jgi:hypothetical protein